jgi:selenide, water dikinase
MGFDSDTAGLENAFAMILYDAQTSGGLLIAIAPERAERLREALGARGVLAARIGRLVRHSGGKKVSVR